MAASEFKPWKPLRKKIVLPISEAFANILFEGPDHVVNVSGAGDETRRLLFKQYDNFQDAARGVVALDLTISMDARYIITQIFRKSRDEINQEKWRSIPDDTAIMRIDDDDRSILRIYSWHQGSKTHDPVYEFYGEWDDSGPRLTLKRLVGPMFYPTLKTVNRFIERLKAMDEWVAGQPDVTVRMAQAKPEVEAGNVVFDPSRSTPRVGIRPNLRNAGPGRPALPENILQSVLLPMIQNTNAKKNIAKPLSRLVKKGGSRKKVQKKRTHKKTRRN